MQAVAEHGAKEGILGTHYFLKLMIRFTPTELAVIKRRELGEVIVAEGARKPLATRHQIELVWASRFAPIPIIVILVLWWFGIGFHEFPYVYLSMLVFLNIAGTYLSAKLNRKPFPEPIFVEEVLRERPVRLYTTTPFHTKVLVPEVKEQLERLKIVIDGSADLGPTETWEF